MKKNTIPRSTLAWAQLAGIILLLMVVIGCMLLWQTFFIERQEPLPFPITMGNTGAAMVIFVMVGGLFVFYELGDYRKIYQVNPSKFDLKLGIATAKFLLCLPLGLGIWWFRHHPKWYQKAEEVYQKKMMSFIFEEARDNICNPKQIARSINELEELGCPPKVITKVIIFLITKVIDLLESKKEQCAAQNKEWKDTEQRFKESSPTSTERDQRVFNSILKLIHKEQNAIHSEIKKLEDNLQEIRPVKEKYLEKQSLET